MNDYIRALRLVVRLQQPDGRFKRVPAEYEIIVPGLERQANFAKDNHADAVALLSTMQRDSKGSSQRRDDASFCVRGVRANLSLRVARESLACRHECYIHSSIIVDHLLASPCL